MDGMLTKIENLLEQHTFYDLGDEWTISRREPGRWCIYFQGKHIDCWDAENRKQPIPEHDDLTTFSNAVGAVAGAFACRLIDRWPNHKQ